MSALYCEKAFEDAIEAYLLEHGGYVKGNPTDFNRELALDLAHLFTFIAATQGKVWDNLRTHHGANLETAFLGVLVKNLTERGTLDVLRNGVKFYGKLIRLAYFKPASGLNPDTQALYARNRLVVTRQVKYSTKNENSVDMLLSINGLPVATLELKNHLTGQTVENAQAQYMTDRDPTEPLFQFTQRALVHFAVDPDLAFMTTKLDGKHTVFLPFNQGNGTGAGNPVNPDGGYRTAYLWEAVLERHSLLDIVCRFMHLAVDEKIVGGKKIRKETMIFPRYHQLDVVRRLEDDVRQSGAGKNYLIQHSAGSGKSNSIAWLAHRLSTLQSNDEKVFHSVVVITDRLVLDRQLQDTIYQFEHKLGVVQKIDENSAQLADALKAGTPIIVTTLQKFPFVTKHVGELPDRRYAVIVDECHSSASGEGALAMKAVLAAKSLEEAAKQEADAQGMDAYEEQILKVMLARGQQPNMSFFGFTATPKYRTLEVFGQSGPDGKPVPFHLYSMRQAIEEKFILDVLQHYITYKAYTHLIKSIDDDPEVERHQAAKALARFMSLHPYNIAQKTEVMVEHFRTFTRHKIGGRAKAMVVTSSRLHAVRYKQAFDAYIAEKKYTDVKTLVAFSGTVIDDLNTEVTYTEVEMNGGIKEKELPTRFSTDEYQVLLVAEKYQTGFDQPLLHTMYIDRRLTGLQAVQTLSRLNRMCQGKEDTFILDFVNEPWEIQDAFQPYYEQTIVGERADPQQLYSLQRSLEEFKVYSTQEVESFCKVFFTPKVTQSVHDHARMHGYLNPAVDRFNALDEEKQEEFRNTLGAFLRLYAFLSQIIPYQDSDLEKLYTYGRFLRTKLPPPDHGPTYHFDDEVALKYYRLQKISEGSICMESGANYSVNGPTAVGTGASHDELVELSQLIDVLNQRLGTDFTPADQLFFDQLTEEAITNPDLMQAAAANAFDNFQIKFNKSFPDIMIDRMEGNQDIVARFLNDETFKQIVMQIVARQVYDQIRAGGEATT